LEAWEGTTIGLDWMLEKAKAKPGFEERYATVTKMLKDMEGEAESPELEKELEEISISCYEAVGAPRVGFDERANEWFRKENWEPAHQDAKAGKLDSNPGYRDFWMQDFETCLEEHKGKYVMELARDKGGEATVSGIAASSTDFRGKVLRFIDGLDADLVNESYEDHNAEECLAYAKRLEAQLPKVPDGPDGKELLQSAIDWLRFWGERGFGYWAWY